MTNLRKVYRAQIIWWEENCQINGVHYTEEDCKAWAKCNMDKWPGGELHFSEHYLDETKPFFGACPEFDK